MFSFWQWKYAQKKFSNSIILRFMESSWVKIELVLENRRGNNGCSIAESVCLWVVAQVALRILRFLYAIYNTCIYVYCFNNSFLKTHCLLVVVVCYTVGTSVPTAESGVFKLLDIRLFPANCYSFIFNNIIFFTFTHLCVCKLYTSKLMLYLQSLFMIDLLVDKFNFNIAAKQVPLRREEIKESRLGFWEKI